MIAEQNVPRPVRLLPLAVAATVVVAGIPMLVVTIVRITGLLRSTVLATALGMILAAGASYAAGRWWERWGRSRDVLFGDLMIWGWVRRWRTLHRLASALELLDLDRGRSAGRELTFSTERFSAERQARALEQLAASLEARDPYTHGHSRRVARYATMIAKRLGLAQHEVARIRAAAAMHDVGKIETPTGVLHKRGALSDAEFKVIRRHPVDGARLVARVGDDELTAIVRHHHERLDGSGYPDGLEGTAIPLGARIIAVADTFDAVTSERPYRSAKPHKNAIEILRHEAGCQLDPDAVEAFCRLYFARGPIGLWIAATNALERAGSWLVAETAGSTARVAAIATTTAALGAGAVALPAVAVRRSPGPARAHVAEVASRHGAAVRAPAVVARGDDPAGAAGARFSRRGTARAARPSRPPASAPAATPAPVKPPAGVAAQAPVTSPNTGSVSGAGASAGAGAVTTTAAAGPAAGSPDTGATATPAKGSGSPPLVGANVGGSSGVGVTVGGGTGGSTGVGVTVGGGAGGSTGVGVTVGGGSGGSTGVGVTVGGGSGASTGVGVTVTGAGGSTGVGVSLGGSTGIGIKLGGG